MKITVFRAAAHGTRPWAVPGAHGPRAGATVPGAGNPVVPASGPAVAVLASACGAHQFPAYAAAVTAMFREAAITWGRIADIAYQRGDYDEAAELQRKRLEANKQLGDLDGIAAANWDLA